MIVMHVCVWGFEVGGGLIRKIVIEGFGNWAVGLFGLLQPQRYQSSPNIICRLCEIKSRNLYRLLPQDMTQSFVYNVYLSKHGIPNAACGLGFLFVYMSQSLIGIRPNAGLCPDQSTGSRQPMD